jgi:hypothetical protein
VVQFLFLAAFLCNMVGHGFTMYTPGHPRWSTKPLGISSFSCLAFATLAILMGYAYILVTFGIAAANPMAFAPGPGRMGGAGMMAQGMGLVVMLMLAGSLAYLAGSIIFMFYLNNLCLRINQHALAKSVIMCFIASVAYVVIYFLMSCLMGIIAGGVMADVRNANQAAATGTTMVYVLGAFGCIMGLIGLAIFIWYVVILYQVRGALDSYVRRKL